MCMPMRLSLNFGLLQFRARGLYEYTDWGGLHYQAEKRLYGDSLDDLMLRAREFDKNELIKFLQDIPTKG